MSLKISGWGNYPKIKPNKIFSFDSHNSLTKIIDAHDNLIPQGNSRSYGDSALNKNIIKLKTYNYLLDFDNKTGILHCQAGVLLAEILDIFIPQGWFLTITPGTKLITIGGAIASDVHGKNHHIAGCFSECIVSFRLMLPNGNIVKCSKQENTELFKTTCGGMGLTGIILDAKIELQKINSTTIKQTTIKTKNLQETFSAFEKYKNEPYSVAWIDCLAKGENIGRCLLTIGRFNDDGKIYYESSKKINIPFYLPSFLLNKFSVKVFNWLYYKKINKKISEQQVNIDTFFYPLDAINNWNRLYSKKGFLQYQFILPKKNSLTGLTEILNHIADSGKGSFLAVLKLFGKANDNYLSFPLEGYSLALDFKITKSLFIILNELDKLVIKYNGRIYLAKDARVSRAVFEQGYANIDKFRKLRQKYGMDKKFSSLQSKRLNI